MKLLMNPKVEYLVQASLEVLHEQSLEWISEIAFMKEEIVFLNKLLDKTSDHFPTAKSADLDKALTSFNSDTLTVLHIRIADHESWLADVIKTDMFKKQQSHREIHREIMEEMEAGRLKFLQIKKNIFASLKS